MGEHDFGLKEKNHTRETMSQLLESLVPAPPQPCILQGDEPDVAGEECPAVVGRAACTWLGSVPMSVCHPLGALEHPEERR